MLNGKKNQQIGSGLLRIGPVSYREATLQAVKFVTIFLVIRLIPDVDSQFFYLTLEGIRRAYTNED